MRLKRIRLAGFKSFVDPTTIPFPGDMTAILGPNGCGKSNVIDAVRWVLGESSAKNLRGDAMTDVIFNGSSARKPVSQCSVELVFDNTSGRIAGEYAAYNELSIKRIVTKDAISTYLLNSAKCRRRDITDLFLGTGLGPRSYAIIEQGMISKLIESRPQELRVFIEEAAGVSKYKERRKETQTRIQHTKDNLARLEDVRAELGEQLAKLKRQAAAATKYKELKQEERSLKAQLATLRWLAQTESVKKSDKIILALREQLNDLMAGKQQDESGLQSLKNEQVMCKQNISDIQQQIYALGNDITKLEQSQLFAKKRGSQIQVEIEQISIQSGEVKLALSALDLELDNTEQQLMEAEPEQLTLEEQLEDISLRKQDAESALETLNREYKLQDEAYLQQKQALQKLHGNMQQTLSLQQRTETRITELNNELAEFVDEGDEEACLLKEQIEEANIVLLTQEEGKDSAQSALNEVKKNETENEARYRDLEKQQLTLQAQYNTLSAMQASNKNKLPANLQDVSRPVWQAFSVPEGYEKALETVLRLFGDALVCDTQLEMDLSVSTSTSVLFSRYFTVEKTPNTLAALITQERVPAFFNSIFVASNESALENYYTSLQAEQSIITKDGRWIFTGTMITGELQQDSKVERAATMRNIRAELYALDVSISDAEATLETSRQSVSRAQLVFDNASEALRQSQQKAQHLESQWQLLKMRQQQEQQRRQRVQQELDKQTQTLLEEQESLALINEQIEELSVQVAELEDERQERDAVREQRSRQIQDINVQHNQIQRKTHEQALMTQRLQNSYQMLNEQKRNKSQQMNDFTEKLSLLREEAETLLMPTEGQNEKLQTMLQEKESLAEKQRSEGLQLAKVEEQISDIEKGQAGINARVDALKAEIESERLQGETARVRAQSFIEQLAEMKQSIKDVLDNLPEDADEQAYQDRLEKVSAALQRLGAVNLAAVEEYEEQAERKQHLDSQNDDLSLALDTLEAAMRKIDKETRSRFKATFDKVNDDLKSLFPKVFGGGSAYLALTEDDLLETGVTIMARPPGKKNSTIQLLSGGEKALTALSLVFAIFRLNPAPFCLLDEVDAPLDDANVGRFCKLVAEMSKTVQFIYITHNKVAMEMATHLTGVTMAEPGVSRMVSVDMEEALAIAE
ncbi:chromosome segregation protein SMC [Agaribacter flavus]|uniref:Chromosome partition protein Smc n=1 Tax=Agaribacter flavus TaxID=1902781 RepID=A0ABV7FJ22_9ALTE